MDAHSETSDPCSRTYLAFALLVRRVCFPHKNERLEQFLLDVLILTQLIYCQIHPYLVILDSLDIILVVSLVCLKKVLRGKCIP